MSSGKLSTSGVSLGYTERAASALKTGTAAAAAAGFTVGSTIAYVAPHMAGAIDVIIVKQPDGSLKSSPFYVRFGKYSQLRTANKGVQISVNDVKMDFTMRLGRTGEAYFVEDKDEDTNPGAAEDDYLAGAMSPLSGYSSGEDGNFSRFSGGLPGASPEQPTFGNRLQQLKHHQKAGDMGPADGSGRTARLASRPSLGFSGQASGQLQTSSSAPVTPSLLSPLPGASPPEKAFSQPTPLPQASPGPASLTRDQSGRDATAVQPPAQVEHAQHSSPSPRVLRGFEAKQVSEPAHRKAVPPAATPPSILTADLVAAAASAAADVGRANSGVVRNVVNAAAYPSVGTSASEDAGNGRQVEEGASASEGVLGHNSHQGHASRANGTGAHRAAETDPRPGTGAGEWQEERLSERGSSPLVSRPLSPESLVDSDGEGAPPRGISVQGTSPRALQGSASRPPAHPWSVGKPRLLPTPLATQPLPAVVSASDAAKPVKGPQDDSGPTAIAAVPDKPQGLGEGQKGNRVELEAEEELINKEGEAAPYALYEAHLERKAWDNGGPSPVVEDPSYMAIAEELDEAAGASLSTDVREGDTSPRPPFQSPFAESGSETSPSPGYVMPSSFGGDESRRAGKVSTPAGKAGPVPGDVGSGDASPCPAAAVGINRAPSSSSSVGPLPMSPYGEGPTEQTVASPAQAAPLAHSPDLAEERLSGLSPSEGGYWADSERRTPPVPTAPPSPPNGLERPAGIDARGRLRGFALSMCGDKIREGMSPEEAAEVFDAHLVKQNQFATAAPQMLASAELVCRVGGFLYPWRVGAPLVLGTLAFGDSWHPVLPEAAAGIPVRLPLENLPEGETPLEKQAPRLGTLTTAERSSWRLWLGSWRSASMSMARSEDSIGLRPSGMPRSSSLQDLLMPQQKVLKRRAFVPTPEQLASLPLHQGQNTVDFTFGKTRLRAYIYFLQWNTRLIISDVDGTITRSDILGHVLPRVGLDWSHDGINRLFNNIRANGYEIMFLSSRAIAQASATRDYLHTLTQKGETLPPGPVIISPDGLFPSLYRELVLRRPHEFKIRALEDIRALFPPDWNPFYAGFGNRDTDEISYLTVGVPASKIFIINPRGELRKASASVDTSTWSTLTGVNELVHQVFPPIVTRANDDIQEREEFNDYNYWHKAPALIVESDEELFEDGLGGDEEEESDEYKSAEEEVSSSYWRP